MNSDVITINVGGSHFMTRVSTLSSAGYFKAMLERWTTAKLSSDFYFSSTVVTPEQKQQNKKMKRASSYHENDSNEPSLSSHPHATNNAAFFIDGDPDIFEDVLYFMRRNHIKPSTTLDTYRLEQLRIEADFFSYDALLEACLLLQRSEKATTTARYGCSKIERDDEHDDIYIDVPEGEVLYLMSAVLVGECRMKRYSNNKDLINKNTNNSNGVYLATCEANDTGDFQLLFNIYNQNGESFFLGDTEYDDMEYAPRCIAHVGLDQITTNSSTNIDFCCHLDLCLAPPNGLKGQVMLTSLGSGTWNVHWWTGRPEDIPYLRKK